MESVLFQTINKIILFALNTQLGRRYFGINKELKKQDLIVGFSPNAYFIELEKDNNKQIITAVFRTYPLITKRIKLFLKALKWITFGVAAQQTEFALAMLTTTNFVPNSDPEGTSVDGAAARNDVTETWGNIRSGAGNLSGDSGVQNTYWRMEGQNVSQRFKDLFRSWWGYDTSSIGNSTTILSGTIKFFGGPTKGTALADGETIVSGGTPASNTAIVDADYAITNYGGGTMSDTGILASNWSTSGYNEFPLNATGLGYIKKTGVTNFTGREHNYDVKGTTPFWSINSSFVSAFSSDNGSAATDPILSVTFDTVVSDTSGNPGFFGGGLTAL